MCVYERFKRIRAAALIVGLLFSVTPALQAQTGNCQPHINIAVQPQTLCSANTPTIVATAIGAGASPTYRWKKNGVVAGSNSATFSGPLVVGDEVFCEVVPSGCTANVSVASNTFRLEAVNLIQPEVTVVASSTNVCAGTPITFTATNVSGNTNPVYQWMINGNPVPGSNNPVLTVVNISDGAQVQCLMSVPQCTSPQGGSTKDLSDPITIKVGQTLQPTIAITTPSLQVCKGTSVTFTATATNAGNTPEYIWKLNGATVQTGGSSFSTTALNNGDKIQCLVQVAAAETCGQGLPALSNVLEMQVAEAQTPTVSIVASDAEICYGTEVYFDATATGAGASPKYQWQVNGAATGNSQPRFTSSVLNDGDEVRCLLTAVTGCGNATITSNAVIMGVDNPPTISIPEDTITIWAGEQAQLKATIAGDLAFYQWSPAASLVFDQTLEPITHPLENPVKFMLQATAANGCVASGNIWVDVKRNLFLPNSFTPNGDGINDVFRIPAGVAMELKSFAVFDRWGNAIFTTRNVSTGWDGTIKSKPAPVGVYVYLLEGMFGGAPVLLKGTVLLVK